MNEITVSYDQNRAVRICDGAELVAVDFIPGRAWSRCDNCAAAAETTLRFPSCYDAQTRERQCSAPQRRDSRDIIWRLKNG